ncbi:TetR/AcrR family transcriptional regulator [Lacibacter luteus]|uniref:TetR/AcrR family transcriptional regulator n=1 Tax=Lacibacter luteus TaxID=2508719 RepID=A0A4Q1CNR9_9BACT|nr:TetR/AcrR family transcriptional regulator [Lacibacter luteus]RXK62730.1 TetR/AcrR family transcriptional regulator [Lacibacter luteus]
MAKRVKDHSTEDLILDAARKVFVKKGMYGARMQDIADEAGINKALLHYYFTSKEMLFEKVFEEAAAHLFPKINAIFDSDDDVYTKIERFCDEYITVVLENPYLPLFVMNEVNQDPEYFLKKLWGKKNKPNPTKFMQQLDEEVKKGKIKPISPLQLMMNLISMVIFPFVAKPILQVNLGLDEFQFRHAMEQRRKEIPAFIIAAIKK